jgi:uncharacterized protein (DUF58 family)
LLTRNGYAFLGIAALCIAAAVQFGYREMYVVGFGLLLAVAFAVAWLLLRPRLEVTRMVSPDRVSEGDGAAGVLRAANVGHRRCPPVEAREAFAGESISISLPSIAPGSVYTGNYLLPAERRGYYAVGPLQISHSDPLRLIDVTRRHGSEVTLWVHPRIHRMAPVPTGRTQDLDGPTNATSPRGGIAFHSLREYVPGDDPRLIHWRSSARLETLMVKHTVITNEPRILVVLDTSADPYHDESFEDAVRIAASLVVACADRRYPTEFRTTGGIVGSVDPSGQGRVDVLDKLAAVQSSNRDGGLEELTRHAASREQGVSMAVVTGQPGPDKGQYVAQVRGRFQMVTLVQLGDRLERDHLSIAGVLGVSGATSDDLARLWRIKVGSA